MQESSLLPVLYSEFEVKFQGGAQWRLRGEEMEEKEGAELV